MVIDAGTGLGRLVNLRNSLFGQEWTKLEGIRILLTHYHLDHSAGLFWIKGIFGNRPISIYAPGKDIYGRTAYDLLHGLFQKPYSPHRLEEFGPNIRIHDLSLEGITVESGSEALKINVRANANHSDPSVSLRFSNYFGFITDTPPENGLIDFVRGVEVLFHESWYNSESAFKSMDDPLENHSNGPHTGSIGAGLIAHRAGVRRLYLMHHNPERSISEIEKDAEGVRRLIGIETYPAMDLQAIEI